MMEYFFLKKKSFFLQFNFIFLQFNFILLTRTKGVDMKKMLCLAVFALGLATPAVAADWVLVSTDSNEAYTIIGDADSRTDDRAWFEIRYAKPQKIGDGKIYNTTKSLDEIDCSGKRHRILTITAYSKSGNSIVSYTPSYAEWRYVIPGTVGESMYKFVCNGYPR
jgi:hypothetical protein